MKRAGKQHAVHAPILFPNGRRLDYTYDGAERLMAMRDNAGYETCHTYDSSDNLLSTKTYNVDTGQQIPDPAPGSAILAPLPDTDIEIDITMAYNTINLVNKINQAGSITRNSASNNLAGQTK